MTNASVLAFFHYVHCYLGLTEDHLVSTKFEFGTPTRQKCCRADDSLSCQRKIIISWNFSPASDRFFHDFPMCFPWFFSHLSQLSPVCSAGHEAWWLAPPPLRSLETSASRSAKGVVAKVHMQHVTDPYTYELCMISNYTIYFFLFSINMMIYYIILYFIILCESVLNYIVFYYIIFYCIIVSCIKLYFIILQQTVLNYILLYCSTRILGYCGILQYYLS